MIQTYILLMVVLLINIHVVKGVNFAYMENVYYAKMDGIWVKIYVFHFAEMGW